MRLSNPSKGRFNHGCLGNDDIFSEILRSYFLENRWVKDGDIILNQGKELKELVLVPRGKISLAHTAANGRRLQLGTIECDMQLFGEMEFFTAYACQLDIIAEESFSIHTCSFEEFETALIYHPNLAICFAEAMAIDYQDTLDIFFNRMLYPIAYNIADDLYRQYQNNMPMDGFSKTYLEAERFGTTDRVYRRAVKELIDLGIVIRGNEGLKIINIPLLEAYLKENI